MKNLVLHGERHNVLPSTAVQQVLSSSSCSATHVEVVAVVDASSSGGGQDAAAYPSATMTNSDAIESSQLVLMRNGYVMRLNPSQLAHDDSESHNQVAWITNLNLVVDEENDEQQEEQEDDEWFSMTLLASDGGDGDMVDNSDEMMNEERVVCFSRRRGAIITVWTSTGRASLVGELEHGLHTTPSFSPDGEIVLLVTKMPEKTVLLSMTTSMAQFDVLGEVTLVEHEPSEEEKEEDSAVSICWKPDGGLFAVTCCIPDSKNPQQKQRVVRIYDRHGLQLQSIGRTEDGSGRLLRKIAAGADMAWAGPSCSQLLAVATTNTASKKTAGLVYFLEPNGLQHGQLTLRHDPVDAAAAAASLPNVQVIGLVWNCTSDLLAVTLRCTYNDATDSTFTIVDKVQLWHRCNYHWYLKYELRYMNGQQVVVLQKQQSQAAVSFDEEQPHSLRVLLTHTSDRTASASWRTYTWNWHSASPAQTAYVIDGSSLLVTPLYRSMVPPPMAACTISLSCPILSVISRADGDILLVHLSNETFVILTTAQTRRGASSSADCLIANYTPPTIVATTETIAPNDPRLFLRQFAVVGNIQQDTSETILLNNNSLRLVAVAAADPTTKCRTECLVEMSLSWQTPATAETNSNAVVELLGGPLPLEAPVLALVNWSDSVHSLLIELDDGLLLEYQLNADISDSRVSGSILPSLADPLLEPCPWIAGLENPATFLIKSDNDIDNSDNDPFSHDEHHHHLRKRLVIGRSSRSRLYCHDILLADTVSSFHLSTGHHFLCYATAGSSRCEVRFLSLLELYQFDPLVGSDENQLTLQGYEPRQVERGSRIVSVLSTGQPSVVLQMPRGNIEGIYPRALVLRQVMIQIAERKYRQAFELMRRQKVDLNLLVDMDLWCFVQANSDNDENGVDDGATCFVKQIKNANHLNLFISCLQNFDSTQWRYPVPGWLEAEVKRASRRDESITKQFDFSTKVNQVCQRLRSIFTDSEQSGKVPDGHYLLPILSTFAKEDPPKLEDALNLIKANALARAPASSKKPPLFSEHAQSSIQYLAFLADYELLFETALGMYDFDIARAVARNSQMDPKEYLPLLKRYRALPMYYGRYEVDLRLERYESALKNLFASNTHEESIGPETGVPLDMDKTNVVPGNGVENCMTLIEEKKLHRQGLELFHANDEARRRIMIDLGDVLLKDRKAENALNIYLNASPIDEERVKKAARACRDWRTFFAFAFKQNSQEENVAPDIQSSKRLLLAREVAEELVASSDAIFNKRRVLSEAARILLDYGNDVVEAVDVLIKAEQWSEAKRIAILHERPELIRRTVDAAISYAQTTIEDMEERATNFATTNDRYVEVLRIRKEAYAQGEVDAMDAQQQEDDNGSLFSATSNSSALSAMSRASAGSTGSTGSISTVISVKSKSNFSLVGTDDTFRHKSKFNKIGRNKKKKKKKGGRTKVIPGSEQELQELVQTLTSLLIDSQYCDAIGWTITFLVQVGEMSLARALYDAYLDLSNKISDTQEKRRELIAQEKLVNEQAARREGLAQQHQTDHPSESVVNALTCLDLPKALDELFESVPPL